MARSTSGRSLSACCSVKYRVTCSNTRDLNGKGPAAGPVEFREDNALPGAQQHRRVAHLEAEGLAHEHAAHVRIGVAALAIRGLRIIVAIGIVAVDHALEECAYIVHEGVLPLVQKQRRSSVQGLQVHQAVANAALAYAFVTSGRTPSCT